MAVATIPVLSKEYVWVPVTAEEQDASYLVTLDVEFAFLASKTAQPQESDWVAGGWASLDGINFTEELTLVGATATARCLVGPGGAKVLSVGTYYVWLRITGADERPVRVVGQLKITATV